MVGSVPQRRDRPYQNRPTVSRLPPPPPVPFPRRHMSAAPKHHEPWPMKWIALAILLFIVPYTYLTLHFRKPGKAFEPYADLSKRANTARLLSAGYQRIPLP